MGIWLIQEIRLCAESRSMINLEINAVPEIWVDLSCPWCFGSLPVLRKLLTGPVSWHFVRLRPWPSQGAPCQVDQEVVDYNRERGCQVPTNPDRWLPHPELPHRLLNLAQNHGLDMWAVALAAWQAWWQNDQDLSKLEVLRKNLDQLIPEAIWQELEAGGGQAQVEADRRLADDIKLDGVPRIYINGHIIPAWIATEEIEKGYRAACQ